MTMKHSKKKKYKSTNNNNNTKNSESNSNSNSNSKKNKLKKSKKKEKKTKKKILVNNRSNDNNNSNFNIIMYKFYNENDDNTIKKYKNRCMCTDYDVHNNDFSLENNQDYRRCKNEALKGKNFCKKHIKCGTYLKLFTNGDEEDYQPNSWNHPYIEGTHNCYSYFLNDKQETLKQKCKKICKKNNDDCPKKIKKCGNLKPQPGDHHLLLLQGNTNNKKRDYQCPTMEKKNNER